MTVRAAIYCRISDDRAGAGLGVARQEVDCRALADRNGWDVGHVYVDNDVSAYDRRRKRQQWTSLLDALADGQYDAVIAWHPDRLYRQMRDLLALIDLCDRGRVKVATVTAGDVDLSTATGRAVAKTVAAWNEHESEHKSERNRAKALELANAGKLGNGGPRPFGYQPDRITLDPVEAALLRTAYLDVAAGKGLNTICREWHAQGIRTSQGNPWTIQGLRFTLLRARNIGWREHRGRLAAPAVWQPIIDRDTWEQVRLRLTAPDRPNIGQTHGRRYLLSGLLHCGTCNDTLLPHGTAERKSFACRPAPDKMCPHRVGISYPPVERDIVALVLARLDHEPDLEPEPDDPIGPLREQIAAREAQLRNLAATYADSGDFLEMRTLGDQIRADIARLRRELQAADTRTRLANPLQVRQAWEEYDVAQKRDVVALLIEQITIGPAVRGRAFYDPSRVTVTWR